jgi:hypothetical protein
VRDDNASTQPGKLGTSSNYRPADLPTNVDPKTTKLASGDYAQVQHTQKYGPAIDAAGNADCELGQSGYLSGPLPSSNSPNAVRYPPHGSSNFNVNDPNDPFYRDHAGGSHVVVQSDTPGLAGPTYTGVPSLRQVP